MDPTVAPAASASRHNSSASQGFDGNATWPLDDKGRFSQRNSKASSFARRHPCRYICRAPKACAAMACDFLLCRCRQRGDTGENNLAQTGNTCNDQVLYLVDRLFAKKASQAAFMVVIGCFQVLIGGVTYSFVWDDSSGRSDDDDDELHHLGESLWKAWTFMADPGTHAGLSEPDQRIIGSLITLGGILFFASVLGMTVDMIREKMDTLRKGKSKIIEKDHTLILGWTQKAFHIVEELCNANESMGGGVVAILASESKERMESELNLQLPIKSRRGTRVVIRSGSPLVMGDLVRVSAHMAKAIILLATSVQPDTADANTLRALLSLNTLYGQRLRGFIVAEARDIDNEPLVKLVGNQTVETVVSHDMIGRLMLMSVRQPGLAKVYEALLGFDGDEFYMKCWPELVGIPFGELQSRFPDAVPIGVFSADGTAAGGLRINLKPPSDYVIKDGEEVIVIAEDDDTYKPEEPHEVPESEPPPNPKIGRQLERLLICGWRRDIRDILKQLDRLADAGTEVHMITHCVPLKERNTRLLQDGLDVLDLKKIKIMHHYGNTSVRRHLDELPIETYTSCMIFADQAFESDTMYADSHSLATLLLLRDIQATRTWSANSDGRGSTKEVADISASQALPTSTAIDRLTSRLLANNVTETCPIVCEILDPHTQKTIVGNEHLSTLSDFCQTNRLTAQVMAMVAEERAVKIILDQLLGGNDCNIAVVPSSRYVQKNEMINFFEVSRRAGSFGEVCIGYQRKNSAEKTLLNPRNKHKVLKWDSHDFAILQGNIDSDHTDDGIHAGDIVRGPTDTPWFATMVKRLQDSARTFSKSLVDAGDDPSASAEACLKGMSPHDRRKVKQCLEVFSLAFRRTGLQSDSKQDLGPTRVESRADYVLNITPEPPGFESAVDEVVKNNHKANLRPSGPCDSDASYIPIPPSVPRTTNASPATAKRCVSSQPLSNIY